MKKTFYIIRHGQTEYNKLRIVQGSGIDSDLNDQGREQAHFFYKKYKDIPFQALLTSTLKRTHQTVKQFIEAGIPWEQFDEIKEMNWGVHEGKKGNPDMRKDYERVVLSGQFDERIEEGESINEVAIRLQKFTNHIINRKEDLTLICVHGRVMRIWMALLEVNDLSKMETYDHANTGLYLVEYENRKFTLKKKNDTEHIAIIRNS